MALDACYKAVGGYEPNICTVHVIKNMSSTLAIVTTLSTSTARTRDCYMPTSYLPYLQGLNINPKLPTPFYLQGTDGRALETQVSLEVLSNLTNQALEGQLTDQQFSGLLVATDLTESNSTGPVPMRLLDTSGRGCRLTGSLGGKLLTGGFASSGLTGSLLGTGHCELAAQRINN